jgi:eukaryotic-like serine/threonine-protein kinase
MAKVFRATLQGPAGFTKAVALKVIKGGVHDQMGELQQALFLREARLGGLLRHPNLVDVYELGEVETEWFLSMEWVDGLTLADAIAQRGAPPAPVLISVARGLCAGLHSAHTLTVQGQRVGLVHRDIKPSNVLLGWNGAVKIADFGLAHVGIHMAHGRNVHSSGGSPGYMSPEQWAAELVDARSDLFSLGCVLYELALGESLFELGDAARLRRAVREVELRFTDSGALAALDACCVGLGEVIRRCLRVDPAERYAQVSEVDGVVMSLDEDLSLLQSVSVL